MENSKKVNPDTENRDHGLRTVLVATNVPDGQVARTEFGVMHTSRVDINSFLKDEHIDSYIYKRGDEVGLEYRDGKTGDKLDHSDRVVKKVFVVITKAQGDEAVDENGQLRAKDALKREKTNPWNV